MQDVYWTIAIFVFCAALAFVLTKIFPEKWASLKGRFQKDEKPKNVGIPNKPGGSGPKAHKE